ncbi:hypothetical protein BBJ28_00024581 [Nothophytophthora sp. Chile5]|nr:hypothetical protein BBJ28_00024581 [Nothophytophthora sp. Chile5]
MAASPSPEDAPAQSTAAQRTPTSLYDVVTLLYLNLAPLLEPEDARSLLRCYQHAPLSRGVRNAIATHGLKRFYDRDEAHFGNGCMGDWHRLVPMSPVGGRSGRCACIYDSRTKRNIVPEELPLPRILDARAHLLEAMCLIGEGINPHCFRGLQMDRNFDRRQYGVLQPMLFSLATAVEREQQQTTDGTEEQPKRIDVNDVDELTRLLDSQEAGFGTRFFSPTNQSRQPVGMVEAHWRGIHVDLAADATTCQFCDNGTDAMLEGPKSQQYRAAEYQFMLRQHCREVYQPLKKFMVRHLKHIRYVRPSPGWNDDGSRFRGHEWLDLIAGFTPGGVLCGVYLTNVEIPTNWMGFRVSLAPGAYSFEAIDLTRLRIAN